MSNATAATFLDDSAPGLVFRDGLGDRCLSGRSDSGEPIERFQVIPELASQERALRERVDRLINFRHVRFSRLLGVDTQTLTHNKVVWILSEHEQGVRLSELLAYVDRHPTLVIDVNAALQVAREVLPALAVLHNSRGIMHGALGLERLVLTPLARVTVLDYALGGALGNLAFPRTKLWREFRIAMPPAAGVARFDARADVANVALAVLALLSGRPLASNDFPNGLRALLDSVMERLPNGTVRALSAPLKTWFERTLPIETRRPFTSAADAQMALEDAIKKGAYAPSQNALKSLLQRFDASKATAQKPGESAAGTDSGRAGATGGAPLRLATGRTRVTRPAPMMTPEEEEAEEIRALEAELARLAKLEAERAGNAAATDTAEDNVTAEHHGVAETAPGPADGQQPPVPPKSQELDASAASDALGRLTFRRRRPPKIQIGKEQEIRLDDDEPATTAAAPAPSSSAAAPEPTPFPALESTPARAPLESTHGVTPHELMPAMLPENVSASPADAPALPSAAMAEVAASESIAPRRLEPVDADAVVATQIAPDTIEAATQEKATVPEERLALEEHASPPDEHASDAVAAVAAVNAEEQGNVLGETFTPAEPDRSTLDAELNALSKEASDSTDGAEVEVIAFGSELPALDVAIIAEDTVAAVLPPHVSAYGSDEEIRDLERLLASLQNAEAVPIAAAPRTPVEDSALAGNGERAEHMRPVDDEPVATAESIATARPLSITEPVATGDAVAPAEPIPAAEPITTTEAVASGAGVAVAEFIVSDQPAAVEALAETAPSSEPGWTLTALEIDPASLESAEIPATASARDDATIPLDFSVDAVRRYLRRLIALGVVRDELHRFVATPVLGREEFTRIQVCAAAAPRLPAEATLPFWPARLHRRRTLVPPIALAERVSIAPEALSVQPPCAIERVIAAHAAAPPVLVLVAGTARAEERVRPRALPSQATRVAAELAVAPDGALGRAIAQAHAGAARLLRFVKPKRQEHVVQAELPPATAVESLRASMPETSEPQVRELEVYELDTRALHVPALDVSGPLVEAREPALQPEFTAAHEVVSADAALPKLVAASEPSEDIGPEPDLTTPPEVISEDFALQPQATAAHEAVSADTALPELIAASEPVSEDIGSPSEPTAAGGAAVESQLPPQPTGEEVDARADAVPIVEDSRDVVPDEVATSFLALAQPAPAQDGGAEGISSPHTARQEAAEIEDELERLLRSLETSAPPRETSHPPDPDEQVLRDALAALSAMGPVNPAPEREELEVEIELDSLVSGPSQPSPVRPPEGAVSQPSSTVPPTAAPVPARRKKQQKRRGRAKSAVVVPVAADVAPAAPALVEPPAWRETATPVVKPGEQVVPYEPWRIPKPAVAAGLSAASCPVAPPSSDVWSSDNQASKVAQVVPFTPPAVSAPIDVAGLDRQVPLGPVAASIGEPVAPPVAALPLAAADAAPQAAAPRASRSENSAGRIFAMFDTAPSSEAAASTSAEVPVRSRGFNWRRTAAASLVVILLEGVAFATVYWFVRPSERGTLLVQTSQTGVEVFVDGRASGVTPLKLQLDPGRHTLEMRGYGLQKVVPVEISAGVQTTQTVKWSRAAQFGVLNIKTTPAGARILVDGTYRGTSPLTLDDVAVGPHVVVAESPAGSVRSRAIVNGDISTDVEIGIFSGWLTVFAPVEVRVFEAGKLLGTSLDGKLLIAPGVHDIEIVNKRLGYHEKRKVEIEPGKHTAMSIQPPNGTLMIDAPDGTEVTIDGQVAGTLPVPNLSVPIGTREIVLKHASFGLRKVTVTVTADAPARVSMMAPQ